MFKTGGNKGRLWQQNGGPTPISTLDENKRLNSGNGNGGVVVLMGPTSSKVCDSIRCEYGAVCEIGDDSYPRCTCQVILIVGKLKLRIFIQLYVFYSSTVPLHLELLSVLQILNFIQPIVK